jgi:hypothetical protein
VGEVVGWAIVALVAGGVAHADPDVDPNTQASVGEANLESNAPRDGITIAGALGGGLIISQGKTSSVPALSLRLGQVATPTTVVTLEVVGGTYTHKASTTGSTLLDSEVSLLVGGQVYILPSVWVRGAGGVGSHTTDDGSGQTPHGGLSMLGGFGVDLVRSHYVVFGLEGFYIGNFVREGYTSLSSFGIGLSHY